MNSSPRLALFAVLPLLTGCGANAHDYHGDPIDAVVDACIDYVTQSVSPNDVRRGLTNAGWEFESAASDEERGQLDSTSGRATMGEYQIWYYRQGFSPTTVSNVAKGYSCYIGTVSRDSTAADDLIGHIKTRIGIERDKDTVLDAKFGSASIRRNNFSDGIKVKVHVNFFKAATA